MERRRLRRRRTSRRSRGPRHPRRRAAARNRYEKTTQGQAEAEDEPGRREAVQGDGEWQDQARPLHEAAHPDQEGGGAEAETAGGDPRLRCGCGQREEDVAGLTQTRKPPALRRAGGLIEASRRTGRADVTAWKRDNRSARIGRERQPCLG